MSHGINLVESGYDDDFWVRYEEEKKKLKGERKPEKEESLKSLLFYLKQKLFYVLSLKPRHKKLPQRHRQ